MIAPINKIIPISAVDGKGARTVIFLQGCNLKCIYCHNPETQNLCNSCGICLSKCQTGALYLDNRQISKEMATLTPPSRSDELQESHHKNVRHEFREKSNKKVESNKKVKWNKSICCNCDSCISVCPRFSSPKVQYMTSSDVYIEIMKNVPFIRGITVSGGECTLYCEFLQELFYLVKNLGLSSFIDSNGTLDFQLYPNLIRLCDGVMLDVKAWDRTKYANLTGFWDNSIVKSNLKYLATVEKLEEIRVVIVDKYVDGKAIIQEMAKCLGKLTYNTKLKLIAFRKDGVKGILQNYQSPSETKMLELKKLAVTLGFIL